MRFLYLFYAWLGLIACHQVQARPANDLTKGANVLIRSEETVFTVNSVSSSTTYFKTTIAILNENGSDRAKLYVPYDKLKKVDYINATSYDSFGKKIKSLRKSDIVDVSAVSDGNLFQDNRVKIADLTHSVYPYTVEFEYQVTSGNMLFYPLWMPLDEENLAVEKSTFRVLSPLGMPLRYLEKNLPVPLKKEKTATHEVYTWQVQDLAPVEQEPFGPMFSELVPFVRTAPGTFEVEGYQGSMQNWKDYGLWVGKLNSGRDVLPEATRQKLQSMVAGAKTSEEKVRKIYSYLQGNTRYVSIQLGIGGWQPFEASFVDGKGYGDCKALTNYTQAMLKAVGINSYQALIRAGDGASDILTEFPSQQFNHVVLCVPLERDSLWLECTNQNQAAGYAGSFTGNRHALLITPEGGKLVKTPMYGASDNTQIRSISVQLDEKGNGTASVRTVFSGEQSEARSIALHNVKPDEQKKWLYEHVEVPAFDINSYTWKEQKDAVPSVTEDLELRLRQYATVSGKRLFLKPNLMNKWTYSPVAKEKRLTDVVMRGMAFKDVDTVSFQLPAGFALEFQPQDMDLRTAFGQYKTTIKVDGQQVTYIRSLQMPIGRFKPETYAQLVEFMNKLVSADNQQLVFVKNIP
ncbi:DUF3857 domain-containing protein [Pontibacter sp. 172403-2]|uniref:DUF3857 domain-containing protein n=1 Tax=Pontibacter rufus TaxID=2791028 RepID=UPI0018AF883C|nr:DUF3857 domain-containing protein [Pontibacter sp. 172403-2]MBF9252026.1 DUF3857 domain-containing protein [Pontibacter sp. 172403-2]